jgi:hypothetical protein
MPYQCSRNQQEIVDGYRRIGELLMQDALFVAVTIVFFVLSIGYVRFCERMK